MLTVKQLKQDKEVQAIMDTCEKQISAINFTEHSNRHCSIVASWTGTILQKTGHDEKTVRLGEIAGYLHDIGNAISRHNHAGNGALLAYKLLVDRGLSYEDATEIMMAIGNHDEKHGSPVSNITSALIIADKSDVHKSRVKNQPEEMTIHDRVNLAVKLSYIEVDTIEKRIDTIIETDTEICSVADYFEIYHTRMIMCTKAAEFIGYKYGLLINGIRMM